MFSTLKQRTIAVYHFLTTRRPHLGAFVFISILFLAGYMVAGIYAANTGHLSWLNPQMAIATGTADATAGNASSATDGVGILMGWVIKLLLAAASLMMRLAIFCLAFIIQIAGYNGYLSSTAVNIGWVMVRDITNMFFVVILLLVAFGTILGLEQYEWKKMLVKFFFAAVLVNFSRVICGVIIDVGQVIMITFVNGIAATAGGNLINAFSMDTIFSLSQAADPAAIVKTEELFTASLGALVFSSIILAMMLVFVFMLVSRMVVLWILIVLSPFAFVLSVIPQTQKYASQWWSEFGNHVVVGPAVVFFLWLSFAVVGGGQINTEVAGSSAVPETAKIGGQDSAGIGGIMDWNKMSNFAIAIGILLVGAKTSQSLGTVGGSAMSKATDFGKKVAMVASGASAAMWAGKNVVMPAGKWAAMNAPLVGGKAWIRKGKAIAEVSKIGWSKLNQQRDKWSKKLEEPIKNKQRAEEARARALKKLELEKRAGKYDGAEGQEALKKQETKINETYTKASEKFSSAPMRVLRGLAAGRLESEGRAEKRVKNLEEAAEKEKAFEEGEYSLSSSWGGRLKTAGRARADASDRRQKAKGERYVKDKLLEYGETERLELEIAINDLKGATTDQDKDAKQAAIKKLTGDGLILAAIAAEQQNASTKAQHDEEMSRAEANYINTKEGQGFMSGVNLAEQGKKAAEDFIKTMKGHDLKHAFQVAAEKMTEIIAKGGPDMAENLKLASMRNNYIGSLRQSTLLHEDEEGEHLAMEKAKEIARAGYFEIPKLGRATPSTAMDSMIDSAGKQLKGMNAPDGAVLAASWIAHILQEKESFDKKNALETDVTKHKSISDHQKATLFSAVAHITKEAWTDDTIAEISAMFKDLDIPGRVTDPQRRQDIEAMKKVFGEGGLNMITSTTDSKGNKVYKSESNPENAAALQALVSTGGDMDLVRAHKAIEAATEAETDPDKKLGYWEAAEKLAKAGTINLEEFKGKMQKSQTFLQEAASTFKRAALDAGHLQMGGHQGFDRDADMFRLKTRSEARTAMVGEAVKRKGLESAQFHSLGTVNNELGRLTKIDQDYFRAVMSPVKSAQKAGNVLARTIDQVSGYSANATKETDANGKGLIGGSAANRGKVFANDAEFIKNLILPALRADAEATKFIWAKKMGVADTDANEGKVNLAIELSDGKKIEGELFSQFLTQLNDKLGSFGLDGKDLADTQQALKDAIKVSQVKEADIIARIARGEDKKTKEKRVGDPE